MSEVFSFILRLAVILLGYFAATLGASAFIHLLLVGLFEMTHDEVAFISGGFYVSIPLAAIFIGYLSFFPALACIAAAEFLGRRDWLFYALGGGLVGVATALLRDVGIDRDLGLSEPAVILGCCAAGMAGGLCYWLFAGRSARIAKSA